MALGDPLDELAIRDAWQREIAEELSDEDWDDLWSAAGGCYFTYEQALDDLRALDARLRLRYSAGQAANERSVKAPRRWDAVQRARFAPYEWMRSDLRSRFGLDGPADPEDVHDILRRAASEESKPDSGVYEPDVVVSLGEDMSGRLVMPVFVPNGIGEWLHEATPLAWLCHYARVLHGHTGMERIYATYYLLCEMDPVVPWIHMTAHPVNRRPRDQWATVTIGTMAVTPEELASAYARMRKQILAGEQPSFGRAPASGEQLYEFCRPLREVRRLDWASIASLWNEEHTDQPYSAATLGRLYRRHATTIGGRK